MVSSIQKYKWMQSPKILVSSDALIGYPLGSILHRHGKNKPYYMQQTNRINKMIRHCGTYVAWHAGGWNCQQYIFFLQTCQFSAGLINQGIKEYSSNKKYVPHMYG